MSVCVLRDTQKQIQADISLATLSFPLSVLPFLDVSRGLTSTLQHHLG